MNLQENKNDLFIDWIPPIGKKNQGTQGNLSN